MKRIDIEDMRDIVRDYYVGNPPDDIVMDGTDDAQRITDDTIRWVDDKDEVEIAEDYANIIIREHKQQLRGAIEEAMQYGSGLSQYLRTEHHSALWRSCKETMYKKYHCEKDDAE
jgi:hypothetical protein